jgi:hypothetical protein
VKDIIGIDLAHEYACKESLNSTYINIYDYDVYKEYPVTEEEVLRRIIKQ